MIGKTGADAPMGRGTMCRWAARGRGPFFSFGEGGKGPPTGRGSAPLCGAGMRPPLFFRLAERKVAAAAVEKKGAWVSKSCPLGRFGRGRGSGETVRRRLWGACTGCAWGLGNREGAAPHLSVRSRFRGWSSKGLNHWPRAFRFATRYREVAGAAAEREADQIGHAPLPCNSRSRATD